MSFCLCSCPPSSTLLRWCHNQSISAYENVLCPIVCLSAQCPLGHKNLYKNNVSIRLARTPGLSIIILTFGRKGIEKCVQESQKYEDKP